MPVGSILELYTSVLGWVLYDALWAIFLNTGLFLIPFAIAVIGTLLDLRSSSIEVDSKGIIRVLETKIYVMIFVLFFAVNPMLNVYPSATMYTSMRCGVDTAGNLERFSEELTFKDSDSTFDGAEGGWIVMLDGTIPRAPVWWYLVTRLNHAIAQAGRQELPCQTDLRKMTAGLAQLNIEDPQLQDEVEQFYHDCWQPAANKFAREQPTDDEIPNVLEDTIYDDISWAGSRFFRDKPGYYDALRPSVALNPMYFPYMEVRDSVVSPPGYSEGGFPTCDEWWSADDDGLRDRLVDDLKSGGASSVCDDCFGAWFKYWSTKWFVNSADAEDALVRATLTSDSKRLTMNLTSSTESGSLTDNVAQSLRNVGITLGLLKGGLTDSLKTEGIRLVAPMIQAIVLLVFTMGLPILMTFSSYSLGSLVALSLVQFSIIFWTFLFALAQWLDNFLLSGLLSVADGGSTLIGFALLGDDTAVDGTLDVTAITWVVRACYLLVPLAFSWFISAVGVRAGNQIAQGIGKPSQGVGGAGSNVPMPGPGALGKFVK